MVGAHLDQCAEFRRVFAELGDVNVALKGIVAPIVLGPVAVAYPASAAGKGSAGAWIAARLGWLRHAPKGQQAWTMRGPRFSAFAQPLSAHPAVSFPAANAPYLVGVVTAAAPLVPPAPPAPATTLPSTPQHPPARCPAPPA